MGEADQQNVFIVIPTRMLVSAISRTGEANNIYSTFHSLPSNAGYHPSTCIKNRKVFYIQLTEVFLSVSYFALFPLQIKMEIG